MDLAVGFVAGMFVGFGLGLITLALCVSAGRSER